MKQIFLKNFDFTHFNGPSKNRWNYNFISSTKSSLPLLVFLYPPWVIACEFVFTRRNFLCIQLLAVATRACCWSARRKNHAATKDVTKIFRKRAFHYLLAFCRISHNKSIDGIDNIWPNDIHDRLAMLQSNLNKTSNLNESNSDFLASHTPTPDAQGRIKEGATGAIAPGPLLQGGPRDELYLF